MLHFQLQIVAVLAAALFSHCVTAAQLEANLRVGAAYAEFAASDEMAIAGGIGPGKATGQEGMLRAVATVIQGPPDDSKIAIVACDILMIDRKYLDAAAMEIEKRTGIPFKHILINCTHTHHAPSTVKIHGYDVIEPFALHVRDQIVQAVVKAHGQLSEKQNTASMRFRMGQEQTVGQNSRLLHADGTIYWTGPRNDIVRPTGPFDPDFPVLAFVRSDYSPIAVIFGHSTHTIGPTQPGKRSPAFYGIAAQSFEKDTLAITTFLQGASGSTHLLEIEGASFPRAWKIASDRIGNALRYSLDQAQPFPVQRVAALKRELTVHVRKFNEDEQEQQVKTYCLKQMGPERGESVAAVFRKMRAELAGHQGEARQTWIQAMRIGDLAIVGVPAEFFTQLGLDIKKRSPFRHTMIAELANDYVGYVGNRDAYKLGGYQLWMGHHSWTEAGTGELFVDQIVSLLHELHRQ